MSELHANYRLEFKDAREVSGKAQRAAIRVLVDSARDEIERNTPRGPTGNLRKGVYGQVLDGGESGRVGVKARHAHIIHDGTRANYDISPRQQRAVAYQRGGRTIIRARVTHPGVRANPWVQRSVDDTFARLGPLMAEAGAILEREL